MVSTNRIPNGSRHWSFDWEQLSPWLLGLTMLLAANAALAALKAEDCYYVFYSSGEPGYVCDPNPGDIWWTGVLLKAHGGLAKAPTEPNLSGGVRQKFRARDGYIRTCTVPNRFHGLQVELIGISPSGVSAEGIAAVEIAPSDGSELTLSDLTQAVNEFNLELTQNRVNIRFVLKKAPTRNTRIFVAASDLIPQHLGSTLGVFEGDSSSTKFAYVHYDPFQMHGNIGMRISTLRHEMAHALGLHHGNEDGLDSFDGLMRPGANDLDANAPMSPCELGTLAGIYGTTEKK